MASLSISREFTVGAVDDDQYNTYFDIRKTAFFCREHRTFGGQVMEVVSTRGGPIHPSFPLT